LYVLVPKKSPLKERLDSLEPGVSEYDLQAVADYGTEILGRLGAGIPLRMQDYGKYMRMLIAAAFERRGFLFLWD